MDRTGIMEREIAAFFTSDLSSVALACGQGFVQVFLSNSLAHFALGGIAGAAVFLLQRSTAWLLVPFFIVVLKDFAIDWPLSGFEALVFVDGLWDAFSYVMGFAAIWWAIMSDGKAEPA